MTLNHAASPIENPILEETNDLSIHPTLASYFETFNRGDFQATAALFAPEGQLLPPFESPLVGPDAIAAYLTKEAQGMRAYPQQATQQVLPSGELNSVVGGQVQTPLFTVNVKWQFVLDPQAKIMQAQIKLLASLKDLLHLQR